MPQLPPNTQQKKEEKSFFSNYGIVTAFVVVGICTSTLLGVATFLLCGACFQAFYNSQSAANRRRAAGIIDTKNNLEKTTPIPPLSQETHKIPEPLGGKEPNTNINISPKPFNPNVEGGGMYREYIEQQKLLEEEEKRRRMLEGQSV